MNEIKQDPHIHGKNCGCNAPHPLFGLCVAAIVVALGLLLLRWLM